MNNPTAIAHRRLLAVLCLTTAAAIFACRPAWSPDSSRVLYPGKVDGKLAFAEYHVETGANRLVMVTEQPKTMAQPIYLSNDELLLVSNKSNESQPLLVTRKRIRDADKATPGPFEIQTDSNAQDFTILPPVVIGDQLFLGGKSLTRIDLESGRTTRVDLPEGAKELVLNPRGDGICYVTTRQKGKEHEWELGIVDPKTLATRKLFAAPAPKGTDLGWKVLPLPAFSKDLSRVALPGERIKASGQEDAEVAILVFHDGKLETVMPLGKSEKEVGIGSLAFSADDATVLAVIARAQGERQGFALYENSLRDHATRETLLLQAPQMAPAQTPALIPVLQMQLSLSPDGKWAAVTTSYVSDDADQDKALLLIDVSGKERTVKAVKFPAPQQKQEGTTDARRKKG